MRIERGAAFPGPSVHAAFPAIWLRIQRMPGDLGDQLEAAALAPALGLLSDLRVGGAVDARGVIAAFAPAGPSLSPAAAIARLALELQRLASVEAAQWSVSDDPAAAVFDVAFAYEHADLGMRAGQLAVALIDLVAAPAGDRQSAALAEIAQRKSAFTRVADNHWLDPQVVSVLRALRLRDIPVRRLNPRLYVLGQGRFQQHLDLSITGNTSLLGNRIATDKRLSNRLLRELGLPATEQVAVSSERDAVRAAERLGYPVVLKPMSGNKGRLVFVGVTDAKGVANAYARIVEAGQAVLMERLVRGDDYRLLVVAGELIGVNKRVPGHVVGDGQRSVEALVREVNTEPRRQPGNAGAMVYLDLDDEADRLLRKVGLRRDSVPAPGQVVYLRGVSNLSQGGSSVEMADAIHPENREMALRVAAACRIDVIGIDFITSDITRSYREVGGAICEVNTKPGIGNHEEPGEGRPRDVATPIIESLFPPGRPGRIPSAAILGGGDAMAWLLAHILKLGGHRVGLSLRGTVCIDSPFITAEGASSPRAAAMVLGDALVDAAVMLFAAEDLTTHGLGFDAAGVGAVLGPSGAAAALGRLIVDGARDAVVLDLAHPEAIGLAQHAGTRRRVILTANVPPVSPPGAATLVVTGSPAEITVTGGVAAPLSLASPAGVPDAAAAVAIALAMGVAVDHVRLALASFAGGLTSRLGSFRVLRPAGGPLVVLDRLGGNPLLSEVCGLAAIAAGGKPGMAVIAGGSEADRHAAAAVVAGLGPAFARVIAVDDAPDRPVGDDRTAIAAAMAAAGNGVVLVLAAELERACRYVGYPRGITSPP